ncbi:gustatory and pheromone receptor 32a-like [Musca domestica]|uniref:Gustatory receptor n=2 Tax=Musca domestica TaxID=7370 RepID=A0A9J7I8H2_MUSDO|nr:gustatory and pheromone receptor 32a-like [Musca domestica]
MTTSAEMASRKFYEYLLKVRAYFLGNFSSSELGYVVFPFLKIFKLFGFMPIRLDQSYLFNERSKMVWDLWAILWSFLGSVIYVGGFVMGVCHIASSKGIERLHEYIVIAYFTTWGQLLSLFILGGFGVLHNWLNMQQLQLLLSRIARIDEQLDRATGRAVNYACMRKKLLMQFVVVFVLTASMSMINCIIIYSDSDNLIFSSSCFWFVCFFPILLLTFKEFQFYNMIFLVKSKFEIINEELTRYGSNSQSQRDRMPNDLLEIFPKSKCSEDDLKQLLHIYVNLSDCVDLLLRIFAWHLVSLTSVSFGVITIQGYNLFAALIVRVLHMSSYHLTVTIGWIFLQIGVICINVSVCSATDRAMSLTGPLLHRITASNNSVDLAFNQIIQIFSMEVVQRRNSFTAAGFFNMDYKLITSIIAAVTTYLLIIIQFHTSMGNPIVPSV